MNNKILFFKKHKKKPVFSIITVVKNSENLILNTIRSVEKQTFKNFEFIIIDGKSNDNTIAQILTKKKLLIVLFRKKIRAFMMQ